MSVSELGKPPEPEDLKKTLQALAEAAGRRPYIVFAGNRLAKYLWDHWADTLKRAGLGWQDLLQVLSQHSHDALDWVTGQLEWDAFIARLQWSLERRARKPARRRTILDYIGEG